MRALLLAMTLLVGCAGPNRWTRSDVIMESTFVAATVVDGLQSVAITDGCREQNPILGRCGDRVPLGVYIPVTVLLHIGLTWLIPHGTWRTAFLGLSDGLELDTVYANQFTALGH